MFKLISSILFTLVLVVGAVTFSVAGKDKDIVDTAVSAGQFNTLAAALTAAGLVDTLKQPGPYTVLASQVVKLSKAKTVNGEMIDIKVVDSKVMIDNATVIKPDVKASNGVIHVIDTVLIP